MNHFYRYLLVTLLLFLPSFQTLFAQEKNKPVDTASQRNVIESVLGTVVRLLQDAALNREEIPTGTYLSRLIDQIKASSPQNGTVTGTELFPIPVVVGNTAYALDDLERLENMLHTLYVEIIELRAGQATVDNATTREELEEIENGLEDALQLTRRVLYNDSDRDTFVETEDPSDVEEEVEERNTRYADRDDDPPRKTHRWRRGSFDRYRDSGVFVGDFAYRWPFPETGLYRSIPAIRYNRVEGFVLGIGSRPLEWDDYERSRIVGQVGYAFALDKWRYEVGVETRAGARRSDFILKLGGSYRRNTATNDLWKSNWVENSLAAFFFENDFFDYYNVEGWTVYAVQRLTPYAQFSAGFRSEEYSSLERNTTWSLFGGDNFRFNPPVDEGRIHSFVFALEGGRVYGFRSLPRGVAFRAELETAGLDGDYTFNRFLADGRFYVPMTNFSSFGVRLRGGIATDEVPFQKGFTLGGIGSVRGYPQNAFFGTRMLLGNAEYIIENIALFDNLIDDLQFFGFMDAGWVGDSLNRNFDFDDVIPSAGFGVGLDDRTVRLELAWPLRDLGTGMQPSLWLRLSPSF